MSTDRLTKHIKNNKNKIPLALGTFILTQPIGQGGNGLVYEATLFDKSVALKFLITDAKGKTKQKKVDRFLAEYFNIITVNDLTNIVRYIDYDLLKIIDEKGELEVPIIIMKRYDCSLMKHQETSNEKEFINLFGFLINTAERIHKAGIIHRDIKPENILVDSGEFVLADFGIASYNPEIFQIRAETDKKERLGNRLFSAPEQEESGIEPHPTMDIYAIGQVLHWYVTGKTHRGTGRKPVPTTFNESTMYDKIIDKCLENDPIRRFKTINEIKTFINEYRNQENSDNNKAQKDPFYYLHLFNNICRRSFPKNESGIVHSSDINKIDRLFNNFKEKFDLFDKNLWWHNGTGNLDFELKQANIGVWRFDHTEYKIQEIWIHYDNRAYNDFILIHYVPLEPFIINGEETDHTVILDGNNHISYAEYNNGYAEVDDMVIDLSEHSVEYIDREREEGYMFIGTFFHCVIRPENDEIVYRFIEQLLNSKVDVDKLKMFEREIRKNKHKEVLMRL
ncbi:MAG: hypothetical protein JWP12_2332 [Bacteroidetes bacterium]|nr:hypothetical protein [Bacteroidota bacterium]